MEADDDKLAELLDLWQRAADAGRPITAEEACALYPELLTEFQLLLRRLGRLKPILRGETEVVDDIVGQVQAGRFTPTSYHAKGGLGLVYRADDTELKRVVALKFLHKLAGLDPESRRRFVSEAEITGKLEHPGVVPVYGLGHDSQNRPYYAMRFIQGTTLGEAIDNLHQQRSLMDGAAWNVEFRRLLRAFASVCQTMAYAHARGIVHRDLKPGNVMLGPYGETLVVDWGLARKFAKADPDETVEPGYDSVKLADDTAEASVTGRVAGSPAFMSPEQARGDRHSIQPASDIYSLGTTLYVLLTGKKPFPGRTAGEVLEEVRFGRFPTLRSVNPLVPRSLEAVCLKAMAFLPRDRYDTAQELAADLDRWMADEPVRAFREPFSHRARRWIKRNRTLAVAGVSVLIVAVAALAVSDILLGAKNKQLTKQKLELDKKNDELKTENAAKESALKRVKEESEKLSAAFDANRNNFDLAEHWIRLNAMFLNHRNSNIDDMVRNEANEYLSKYYQEFIAANHFRPELARELAYAHLKQGEAAYYQAVTDRSGKTGTEPARKLLEQAVEQFANISQEYPADALAAYGEASAALTLGNVLILESKADEAERYGQRACAILAPLCESQRLELARYVRFERPICLLAKAAVLLRDAAVCVDRTRGLPLRNAGAPSSGFPNQEWFERSEACLVIESGNFQIWMPELKIDRFHALVFVGEKLTERNRIPEARANYSLALRESYGTVVHKDDAAAMEPVLAAYYGPIVRVRKTGGERSRMLEARDQFRKLKAVRNWCDDPTGIIAQKWILAGRCSVQLARWSITDKQPERAVQEMEDAFDDLNHTTDETERVNLTKRLLLVKEYYRLLECCQQLEGEWDFQSRLLDRMRIEFKDLETELAGEPWFQREKLHLRALVGACRSELKDKKALDPLELAVKGYREFTDKHPLDDLAHSQFGTALMTCGFARVQFRKEYLEAISDANEALEQFEAYPQVEGATTGRQQALGFLAACHATVADNEMKATPPDRRMAASHVKAGQAALDKLEKLRPLKDPEKQTVQLLELLRKALTQ